MEEEIKKIDSFELVMIACLEVLRKSYPDSRTTNELVTALNDSSVCNRKLATYESSELFVNHALFINGSNVVSGILVEDTEGANHIWKLTADQHGYISTGHQKLTFEFPNFNIKK